MSKVNPLIPTDIYVTSVLSDGELIDGVTVIESSPQGGRAFTERFNSRSQPNDSKAVTIRVRLTQQQRRRIENALTGRQQVHSKAKAMNVRYFQTLLVHDDGTEEIVEPCTSENVARSFVEFFNSCARRGGRTAVSREIDLGSIKLRR